MSKSSSPNCSSAAHGCWDAGSASRPGAACGGTPIEVVVEDGFDRAVGARADIDGALGRGFQTLGAEGAREPDDAETGAKALFGMRAASRISSHSAAVAGPIWRASARMRSIVQPA